MKPTHVLSKDFSDVLEFQRKILFEKRENLEMQMQEIDKNIGVILEAQKAIAE